MRVLLDESIPIDFAREVRELDAATVIGLGWAGLKNGALLRQAVGQFAGLVTMDKNLQYQQNLAAHAIAIVLIRARSNRIHDLRPRCRRSWPQWLQASRARSVSWVHNQQLLLTTADKSITFATRTRFV